jgi:hypothetical protein
VTTNLPDPDQRPPAFWSALKYESVATLRASAASDSRSLHERGARQFQEAFIADPGVWLRRGAPARSSGLKLCRSGARTQSERSLERVLPLHSPSCRLSTDLLVPIMLIGKVLSSDFG